MADVGFAFSIYRWCVGLLSLGEVNLVSIQKPLLICYRNFISKSVSNFRTGGPTLSWLQSLYHRYDKTINSPQRKDFSKENGNHLILQHTRGGPHNYLYEKKENSGMFRSIQRKMGNSSCLSGCQSSNLAFGNLEQNLEISSLESQLWMLAVRCIIISLTQQHILSFLCLQKSSQF